MNTRYLGHILACFAFIGHVIAEDRVTVDLTKDAGFQSFIGRYIAAHNSRDAAAMRELLHPKCRARADKLNQIESGLADRLEIPPKHEITVTVPTERSLAFPNEELAGIARPLIYPVKPTYEIEIRWEEDANHAFASGLVVVHEEGKWYEVMGFYKERTE